MAVNWGMQRYNNPVKLDLSALSKLGEAQQFIANRKLSELTLSQEEIRAKRDKRRQEVLQQVQGNLPAAAQIFKREGDLTAFKDINNHLTAAQETQRKNYQFSAGLAENVLKMPTLLQKQKGLNNMLEEMQRQQIPIPSVLRSPGYNKDKESFLMQLSGGVKKTGGAFSTIYTTGGVGVLDANGFRFLNDPDTGERLQREYADKGYTKGVRNGMDVMINKSNPNDVIVIGKSAEEERKEKVVGIKGQELGLKQADLDLKRAKEARDQELFEAKRVEISQKMRSFRKKNSSQIEELQDFLDIADDVRTSKGLDKTVGVNRFLLGGSEIPIFATEGKDIQADIDRLVSSGVINTMTKLKAESPTGSTGFGALSEKELKTLQNAFSIMGNPGLSLKKKKKELDRIYEVISRRLREHRAFSKEAERFLGSEPTEEEKLDAELEGLF